MNKIKTYTPVLTNMRRSPYKSGTTDQLQVKVDILKNNRLYYNEGVPIELWFNYLGFWYKFVDETTTRYGNKVISHPCLTVPQVSNCLGVAKVTINNITYDSNIVRFNFVYGRSPQGLDEYTIDASGTTDRSGFDIFDGAIRTNTFDRSMGR